MLCLGIVNLVTLMSLGDDMNTQNIMYLYIFHVHKIHYTHTYLYIILEPARYLTIHVQYILYWLVCHQKFKVFCTVARNHNELGFFYHSWKFKIQYTKFSWTNCWCIN